MKAYSNNMVAKKIACQASQPIVLGRAGSAHGPALHGQEILLVDEVDVFFGSNFYGQTHNQVAVLASLEVEALLREMWKNRDNALNALAFSKRSLNGGSTKHWWRNSHTLTRW